MKMRRSAGKPGGTGWLLMVGMALALCLMVTVASAEEAADTDCLPHEVHVDTEGALLTREEKIARMDQAFHDSLTRFEQCQQATAVSGAGSASGGASSGGADDSEASGGASDVRADSTGDNADRQVAGVAMKSVAASDIQGTRAPATDTPSSDTKMSDRSPLTDAPPGSVPQDILALRRGDSSDLDNDSRLEAQIRRAAMAETDPKKQARLWNEYRRYKGLPLKPFAGEQGDADARAQSE